MKNKLSIYVLICIIIISCEGVPTVWENNSNNISFTAEIEQSKARASGTTWEAEDEIGIYMKATGSPLNTSAIQHNVKYINEAGTIIFNAADKSETLCYPDDGPNVDFVAYYPYTKEINNLKYPIDLTNQSDLSKIDFMYSDNATNLNATTLNVPMVFSHQLSKLILNLDNFRSNDLEDVRIIIADTGIKASFDLSTGKLSSATEFGNIQLTFNKDTEYVEAILLPDTDLSNQVLWIIIGEDEEVIYKYSLGSNMALNAFEKSTSYTFNVNLFTNEFKTNPSGGIEDWISGPVIDVTLEQTGETPPAIKGSKKSPFTVSEAQSNQGNSKIWVEGYIVGGFTGSSVGSFIPTANGVRPSSIAIADQPNETNLDAILPIQLPAGKIREALNLPENQSNLGMRIKISGDLERYYSAPGLKNPRDFMFTD